MRLPGSLKPVFGSFGLPLPKKLSRFSPLLWVLLPVLFWLALSNAPLQETWSLLAGLDLWQIAALVVANLAIVLLFSGRWWLILRGLGYRTPYFSLVVYRLGAFGISYFTPGAQFGGEPLQVYLLQDRQQVPGPAALAAVTLDKLFELLVNFSFLAVALLLAILGNPSAILTHPAVALPFGIGLALPLVYLLALGVGRFPLSWLMARLPQGRWIRRLNPVVVSTERLISTFFRRKPAAVVAVLLLSGVIWGLMLFEYWLMLYFLGASLNGVQLLTVLAAARLAFLTPLPGGLGALEASQALAMQALGLPPALGLSASLLIRARDVSLGLLGLAWSGLLLRGRKAPDGLPVPVVYRNPE